MTIFATMPYTKSYKQITNKDAPLKHNLVLKSELLLDLNSNYCIGNEINVRDLEKKQLSGPLLITGWSLRSMAQKGMRHFKKALVFAYKKCGRIVGIHSYGASALPSPHGLRQGAQRGCRTAVAAAAKLRYISMRLVLRHCYTMDWLVDMGSILAVCWSYLYYDCILDKIKLQYQIGF